MRTNRVAMPMLSACLLLGCGPASPPKDLYELPEVEPTIADVADVKTIGRYRSDLEQRSDDSRSNNSRSNNSRSNNSQFGESHRDSLDWPKLFGPDRTSVAANRPIDLVWGGNGPRELWSIDVGSGYGSPVVVGERVVFNHRIGDQEIVQCVDRSSGTTIWTHRYPTTFKCDVEYSDGPYSTPLIDAARVYSVGGQGQFRCLRLEDGEVIWSRNLHEEFDVEDGLFPVGASPLISDGRLFFNLGAADREAGIIALNAETGADLWQATDHLAGYCSPFAAKIHDQKFLFVMTSRGLVSLDPETGKIDWTVEHYSRSPMSYNAVSPIVSDDKLLIMTGPGPGAVCLQVHPDRTQTELWRDRRVLDSQFNTLMLSGPNVIGFTAAGQGGAELRCIEMATGELRWKYHSLLRRGQGLMVNGTLLLLGERGHLAAIVPGDEPKVLSFTEDPLMSEPCYAPPALAGTNLLLRDDKRLACFDLSVD